MPKIEHIIPGAVSSSQIRKLMAQNPELMKGKKKDNTVRGTGMARQGAYRNPPESTAHDVRRGGEFTNHINGWRKSNFGGSRQVGTRTICQSWDWGTQDTKTRYLPPR